MKAEDIDVWDIEPFDGCEIFCPECKEWSNIEGWSEGYTPCELCGEHSAIVCPKCKAQYSLRKRTE